MGTNLALGLLGPLVLLASTTGCILVADGKHLPRRTTKGPLRLAARCGMKPTPAVVERMVRGECRDRTILQLQCSKVTPFQVTGPAAQIRYGWNVSVEMTTRPLSGAVKVQIEERAYLIHKRIYGFAIVAEATSQWGQDGRRRLRWRTRDLGEIDQRLAAVYQEEQRQRAEQRRRHLLEKRERQVAAKRRELERKERRRERSRQVEVARRQAKERARRIAEMEARERAAQRARRQAKEKARRRAAEVARQEVEAARKRKLEELRRELAKQKAQEHRREQNRRRRKTNRPPTPKERATADYGECPPDYEKTVVTWVGKKVEGCKAGDVKVYKPSKTWARAPGSGETVYGWQVRVRVKTKGKKGRNRARFFHFMFRDGEIVSTTRLGAGFRLTAAQPAK